MSIGIMSPDQWRAHDEAAAALLQIRDAEAFFDGSQVELDIMGAMIAADLAAIGGSPHLREKDRRLFASEALAVLGRMRRRCAAESPGFRPCHFIGGPLDGQVVVVHDKQTIHQATQPGPAALYIRIDFDRFVHSPTSVAQ